MILEKTSLEFLIKIKKGSYITKKESKEGPYPVILGGQEPAYYIDKYNHIGRAIVISRSGASAGYVSRWNEPIFITDGFLIEPKDNIDFDFLFYLLKYHQAKLQGLQGGAAIPHVNPRIINSIEVFLPPPTIQKTIVNILSTYDNLIENNQKQIKLLEEAAQRLYKEWFVNLRFPRYKDTPILDGVPEGWQIRPLSDVFTFIRGKSYTSKELSDNQGTLMVNLKNIRAFGGYNRNAEKRFTGKYKEEQQLNPGDIIMGVTDMTKERRLVGHVAMIPNLKEKMIFSMDLIKLIPKNISKNYLYSTMLYGGFSQKISPFANGVNVLHLKPEAMMNLQMLVPSDPIMKSFDSIFIPICSKIEYLQEQMDIASEARDRLLPKLMSGEIEV